MRRIFADRAGPLVAGKLKRDHLRRRALRKDVWLGVRRQEREGAAIEAKAGRAQRELDHRGLEREKERRRGVRALAAERRGVMLDP